MSYLIVGRGLPKLFITSTFILEIFSIKSLFVRYVYLWKKKKKKISFESLGMHSKEYEQ